MFKLIRVFNVCFLVSVITYLEFYFTFAQEHHRSKRYLWGFGSGSYPNNNFPYFPIKDHLDNPLYPNKISDCPTTDGNRTGICVKSPQECVAHGGRLLGNCYVTPVSGSNNPGQNQGIGSIGNWLSPGIQVGFCCFYQVTCGGTIIHNGTYFRNPNAPAPYTDARACSVTIQRFRNDICQIRLDFLVFELGRPRDGSCETDRFVVNGQSQNSIIPPICGYNTGQHLYIDLGPQSNQVTLNVLSLGNRNRAFDIRVTQIHCSSTYRAPSNCLQYNYAVQGSIKSFNYEDSFTSIATGYLNSLDYTICFRKEVGFCTVTFSVPTPYIDQQLNPSQEQQMPQSVPGRYFNIIPETASNNPVGNDQAGAGPYECPYDYLNVAGIRLCGSRFNAQLYPASPNPSVNAEVTDNRTGPIFVRFVSSTNEVGRGFYLNYRMNPCLIGGK